MMSFINPKSNVRIGCWNVRMESSNNAEVSLTWAPEGKRKRGRPRKTWRWTVKEERRRLGCGSWKELEGVAKDRARWKELTFGLMHNLEVPER